MTTQPSKPEALASDEEEQKKLAGKSSATASSAKTSAPNKSAAKPAKPEETWVEVFQTILIALLIAGFVRSFLFQPFNIPSGSMKPTLLIGDFLFVSKFSYGFSRYSLPFSLPLIPGPGRLFFSPPKRGDVVVFKTPADNSNRPHQARDWIAG